MPHTKRFKSRQQNHNMWLWALASVFVLVLSLIYTMETGDFFTLGLITGVLVVGMVISYTRDRSGKAVYQVDPTDLFIRRRGNERRMPLGQIIDASLVDRKAARDYVVQRMKEAEAAGGSKDDVRKVEREFIEYCSIDIGLRSYTFGLGRSIIDQMPQTMKDLVLVRVSNGNDILLSPQYNQDLVGSINKAKRELDQ